MGKTTKRDEGEYIRDRLLDEGEAVDRPGGIEEAPAVEAGILTSKQAVADYLQMSMYQFETLLRKYPFRHSGVSGKVNGRWRTRGADAWRWFVFVQKQETRHPEMRRFRPDEAPELTGIVGR
jgi:hypothetical protein